MESTNPTLVQSLKGGAIAGLAAAILNSIWSLIANGLGATIPPGFTFAVVMSSILPLLIAAIIYWALMKYTSKGMMIWLVVSIGFTLISFVPVFNTAQLPDGTLLDSTFPMLAGPMHGISGLLAAWGIPKWSK